MFKFIFEKTNQNLGRTFREFSGTVKRPLKPRCENHFAFFLDFKAFGQINLKRFRN